jgi:hypothetical protein
MLTEQAVAIQLNRSDDVLIACQDVPAGTQIDEFGLTVQEPVPSGHKIAVRNIASGEPVRRYNQIIGFASKPVLAGEHVHVQNLKVETFDRDLRSSRCDVQRYRSLGRARCDTELPGSVDHGELLGHGRPKDLGSIQR